MSMSAERLVIEAEMRQDVSRETREMKGEVRELRQEVRQADRAADRAGRSFSGMGRFSVGASKMVGGLRIAAFGAVGALGAMTTAVTVLGGGLLKLASDAGETASKFNTVFGPAAEEMNAWASSMHEQFGITTKDLQDAASTFGVFGQAAGIAQRELPAFSKDLAQAGLDLASFYNVDPEEAFLALRSGLAGEAEPLRKFGIFLSDATMKAEAATMGLTGELTEQQKVMVRQRIILGSLGKAEGDLTRTSGSLANQTRALRGRLTEAATAVGSAMVPAAEKWAGVLNDRLGPAVADLAREAPLAGDAFRAAWAGEGITTELGSVVGLAERLAVAGRAVTDGWRGTTDLQLSGPFLTLFEVVDAGRPYIEELLDMGENLGVIFTDLILPVVLDLVDVLPDFLTPLGLAGDLIELVADHGEELQPILTGLIAGFVAWRAATVALNTAQAVGNGIRFLSTASTAGLAAAQAGATTSTGALAAGTGVLNAVMSANPIVLVVAALAALAAGLVYAYNNSETFRNIVDGIWQALQKAWDWILRVGDTAVDLWLKFTPIGQIVSHADDLWGAMKKVYEWVKKAVEWVQKLIDKIPDINLPSIPGADLPGIGRLIPGDTATTRARSAGWDLNGALANTLAHHQAAAAMTPGRQWVSNLFVGGGSGDHPAGRAVDVAGDNLPTYRRNLQRLGGFAELHGSGPSRHVHGVPPMGDTATARRPSSAGGGVRVEVTLAPGAIVVQNPADGLDVERQVSRALGKALRDAAERGELAGLLRSMGVR